MATVARFADHTDAIARTFLNSAAELETALRTSEQLVQTLTVRQARTRRSLVNLRKSLRNRSHHESTRLLKAILIDLDMPLGLQHE